MRAFFQESYNQTVAQENFSISHLGIKLAGADPGF